MSACMSGTRGSGVLSSTVDVLEMSVVRGVGGVGDMCMCLARGGVGGEGGEWMRELALGFTNHVGPGGVLDMCLCVTRFCEQQRQPSSGSAYQKNGKSGPHCWGREGSTQFAQQLESAVTAPPLVGCVVCLIPLLGCCSMCAATVECCVLYPSYVGVFGMFVAIR